MSLLDSVRKLPKRDIYLAPKNNLTELLETELKAVGVSISGFIDNFKADEDTYPPHEIPSTSTPNVLIFSPNYKKEIERSLKGAVAFFVDIVNGEYTFIPASSYRLAVRNKLSKFFHAIEYYKAELKCNFFATINTSEKPSSWRFKAALSEKPNKNRGFVICNGPSLPIERLPELKNEITIACNKIYLAARSVDWSPTFYTIQDKLVMRNLEKTILDMNLKNLVLPTYHLKTHSRIKNAFYFKTRSFYEALQSEEPSFSTDLLHKGLTLGNTTLFMMIQFLAAIGCKEIYLLGADFDYQLSEETQGKKYLFNVPGTQHFSEEYRPATEVWTSPQYDKMIKEAEIFHSQSSLLGIRVFNLSQNSKLPAFPKRPIDEVLKYNTDNEEDSR